MAMKKILVCPKCGSRNIDWHRQKSGGQKECLDCGHIGSFNEEMVDSHGEEMWP